MESSSSARASEPPGRRPTMRDVAREAGVSTALVSIVFRDAPGASERTRRRVTEAADRIGYVVDERARLLRDRKSTRLNSSHVAISYTVFCLKKKSLNDHDHESDNHT